jgi:hypothetical protein
MPCNKRQQQDPEDPLNAIGQELQQLQISHQIMSSWVSYILNIIIQHRTTMRQQHDEVDAIQSHVESLQMQVALAPSDIT